MGIEIKYPARKLIQKGKYCAISLKYKNAMGWTCVASRQIFNKRNNNVDVSGKETKRKTTKKIDRQRK